MPKKSLASEIEPEDQEEVGAPAENHFDVPVSAPVDTVFTLHYCDACGIVSVKDGTCRVCGVTDRHKQVSVQVP